MNRSVLSLLVAALIPVVAFGQQLTSEDKKLVNAARARYYSLEAAGFQSLRCEVKFDLATVPLLPSATDDPMRKLIQSTVFTLVIDSKGRPDVQHHFPPDSSEAMQQQATQVTNLMTALVGGLFQTWPSKGLQGPIPSFDSEIESATPTNAGYSFSLRVPGAPAHVLMDKDFLVTSIDSIGGRIQERPTYTPSPEGLIFTGNDAVDQSKPGQTTEVKYTLELSPVNGLRVPRLVHLQVNNNIDVKYSLEACSATKGQVLHVAPPPGSKQ